MNRYLFLFTLLAFLVFFPVFLGKVNLNANLLVSFYAPYTENLPSKNTGWDQLRIYFPFYSFTLESIRGLEIPLWNPYAFSGHPHMADFQSAVFYPLNVFGLFLPQIEFWHLLRITPVIFASFFTFLYLRSLKLSKVSGFFGALTFGFSPFILTWGEEVVMSPHSILWLPLILYAVEKYREKSAKWPLAVIALSTASTFFAGYMQTAIYLFIFVAFYLLFRFGFGRLFLKRKGFVLLGAFILGVIISAVQLLPSAEIFFNSARAEVTLRDTLFEFLIPIEGLLTFLAPDIFGSPATHNFFRKGVAQYYESVMFVGVAALIFAIYSAVFPLKIKLGESRRFVIFFWTIALVSLSTTLDLPTSRFFLSLPIPFLSTSIANRILFIPAFCVAILAAVGMEGWLSTKNRKIFYVIGGVFLVYTAIFLYLASAKTFSLPYFEQSNLLVQQNINVSLRNLVIPFSVFLASAFLIIFSSNKQGFKKTAAILIIIVSFAHVFRFSYKYVTFNERQYVFPRNSVTNFLVENQVNYRSWGIAGTPFENNFATQYGIYFPEGYDSLNNRSYGEFTYAMQGNDLGSFVFRADAGIGRVSLDEFFVGDEKRKLMDMLGVKYVIGKKDYQEKLSDKGFKLVFEATEPGSEFVVFENLQVSERVFLASNYEGPPAYEEDYLTMEEIDKIRRSMIFEKLLDPDFDFRNSVVLEKPSTISPQAGEGSAEIMSYKPQKVLINTKSDQPKILYISDNYYPGWKAKVDNDEVEILRANYTFRAVPLTPGEHTVEFYFDSTAFKLGLLISAFGAVLLIAFTLARIRLPD